MNKKDAGKLRHRPERMLVLLDDSNPQAAYYIGLLFADGYVGYRGRSISLALRDYDENILFDLASFVGLPRSAVRVKSSQRQNMRVLTLNSVELVDGLSKFGICTRKSESGIPCFPCDCKDTLIAFIHGWIDGDGHVKRQCVVSMKTMDQAVALCKYAKHIGGKGKVSRVGRNNSYFRVVFNKRDNMSFLASLFNQPISCIKRKVDAFNIFYRRNQTSRMMDKKPSDNIIDSLCSGETQRCPG